MRMLLIAIAIGLSSGTAFAQAPLTPDLIARLQHRLQHARHYEVGPVTGEFGPATRAALWHFQRENNLPNTGMPDHATMAALGLGRSNGLTGQMESMERPEGAAGGGVFGTSLYRQ